MAPTLTAPAKTPWHLWLVGAVALLWNASGAITIMLAQAGRLTNIDSDEAAYYAAQPIAQIVATDVALVAALAAAVALLLRSRSAVWLFAISLVAVLLANGYELAAGTSRMFVTPGALIFTVTIAALSVLQLAYAAAMRKRGVLK